MSKHVSSRVLPVLPTAGWGLWLLVFPGCRAAFVLALRGFLHRIYPSRGVLVGIHPIQLPTITPACFAAPLFRPFKPRIARLSRLHIAPVAGWIAALIGRSLYSKTCAHQFVAVFPAVTTDPARRVLLTMYSAGGSPDKRIRAEGKIVVSVKLRLHPSTPITE